MSAPRTARQRPGHTALRRAGLVAVPTVLAALLARLPASVALPVLVVVLSGVDVAAGLVAKSWAVSNSFWTLATGGLLYLLAFWVYGVSLRFGQLSTVTLAWVVVITVADILIDRFWFDVQLPTAKWIAMIVAVGALAFVLTD